MNESERNLHQRVYIRVCRDSLFKLDYVQAAHLSAQILRSHPLLFWAALGSDNMQRIANGTHPCLMKQPN